LSVCLFMLEKLLFFSSVISLSAYIILSLSGEAVLVVLFANFYNIMSEI
jgi:hypothetical protein